MPRRDRAAARAQSQADRLYAVLTGRDDVPSSWARPLSVALSLLVVATTWALVPTALWLMVELRPAGVVLGLIVLAVVWEVRPRGSALPDDAVALTGGTSALSALLAEIAAAAGTAPPRTLAVVPDLNAAVYDGRRRVGRVLLIGAPLWMALAPQARVALLGHELGHFSSGDTRRTAVASAAFQTLGRWRGLLADPPMFAGAPNRAGLLVAVSSLLSRVVFWVVGLVPLTLSWVLLHVTSRDSQRAEYRADRTAARLAGTQAAREALLTIQRSEALDAALQRAALTRRSPLAAAREFHLAELPPLAGPGPRHDAHLFDSHPPIALRLAALDEQVSDGSVVLDQARAAAVDEELAAAFVQVERAVRDRYL